VRRYLQVGDFSSALKMEEIRSSETSVYIICARRHTPEDGILHSHRRKNLKSYIFVIYIIIQSFDAI
jgi:hypothetical protein